jgi:glycosyltransferase involved in cell wall biosynthesis
VAYDLAIVIPVYNESDNIKKTLTGIARAVSHPYTIYIVFDLDSDTTIPAAKSAADELGLNLQFLKNRFGRGALNAIKTGLSFTKEKFVIKKDPEENKRIANSLKVELNQY